MNATPRTFSRADNCDSVNPAALSAPWTLAAEMTIMGTQRPIGTAAGEVPPIGRARRTLNVLRRLREVRDGFPSVVGRIQIPLALTNEVNLVHFRELRWRGRPGVTPVPAATPSERRG
jgi:hypothetical protein